MSDQRAGVPRWGVSHYGRHLRIPECLLNDCHCDEESAVRNEFGVYRVPGRPPQRDDWDAKHDEAMAMRPPNRPTELVVGAVEMALNRAWPYGGRPSDPGGSWTAQLHAPPFREVWSCDHSHATENGAWACAERAIRLVVEQKVNPGDYRWNADDDR